jgi:hypothetical protein
MVLTFALMVSSILLGLFVAALVLSAVETYQGPGVTLTFSVQLNASNAPFDVVATGASPTR